MPGREDFAIIRSGLLTDERAHAVAAEYVRRRWAKEPYALATVVGHVAMLGLWASRETEDGILPGDGVTAAWAALMQPRDEVRAILEVLTTHGMIRDVDGGRYLVGFRDCYAPLLQRRAKNRENAAKARAGKVAAECSPTEVGLRVTLAVDAPGDSRRGDLHGPTNAAGGTL